MQNAIEKIIRESIEVKQKLLSNAELLHKVENLASECAQTFYQNGKILFCGNGGSAADAQHIAAELSGRFYLDRPALFAEALHVNSSFVTAVANDYGFDAVYARMVEAAGREGDILFAISTSGNSSNIYNAVVKAKEIGMLVVGLTGETGGKLKDVVDVLLNVPSGNTPRIQESHILLGHILCELIEKELFQSK
ncbi:MAG: D-sedoheptulose 7-phosphate isomerase [Saprospiraceae bacterium]|nr:D-sedoheptulose 7-phosphate isomerase [Saprospiraceae bacterium]